MGGSVFLVDGIFRLLGFVAVAGCDSFFNCANNSQLHIFGNPNDA